MTSAMAQPTTAPAAMTRRELLESSRNRLEPNGYNLDTLGCDIANRHLP